MEFDKGKVDDVPSAHHSHLGDWYRNTVSSTRYKCSSTITDRYSHVKDYLLKSVCVLYFYYIWIEVGCELSEECIKVLACFALVHFSLVALPCRSRIHYVLHSCCWLFSPFNSSSTCRVKDRYRCYVRCSDSFSILCHSCRPSILIELSIVVWRQFCPCSFTLRFYEFVGRFCLSLIHLSFVYQQWI